jgi:hypothetical protein
LSLLQPEILLWGLPLALIPLVIHLLNRLRYRTVPWGAMGFLLHATRVSTSHARLRQFLILMFRILALLFLAAALARPLLGGMLGSLFGGPPARVIILLDRSGSMEAIDTATHRSARLRVLDQLSEAAMQIDAGTEIVLIDSATLMPQQIVDADMLKRIDKQTGQIIWPAVRRTDSAADITALLNACQAWMSRHPGRRTEIWIASDLQAVSWQPDSQAWANIAKGFEAFGDQVSVRILAANLPTKENLAIRLVNCERHQAGDEAELVLDLDIEATVESDIVVPLNVNIDGQSMQFDVHLETRSMRVRRRLPLRQMMTGGWGSVSLPDDSNRSDNICYFAFGRQRTLRTVVCAGTPAVGRLLHLAAAPLPAAREAALQLSPDTFAPVDLSDVALVIWQGSIAAEHQAKLQRYVDDGGTLLCFPGTDVSNTAILDFATWHDPEQSDVFEIDEWTRDRGVLADAATGVPLALAELDIIQRCRIAADATVLARFDDDQPFILEHRRGSGRIVVCTSLPHPDWSNLHYGAVLVPIVQRLLRVGSWRLDQIVYGECGRLLPVDSEPAWVPAQSGDAESPWQAGVFDSGRRRIVLNAAARESDLPRLSRDDLAPLFGGVDWRLFTETPDDVANRQGELWRACVLLVLLCLLAELVLTTPLATVGLET